ncbi:MAG: hypothetical protein H0W61_15555 [Bacteroidetes bacterium]|nr:hypothetical protein [Bacteroidota bacterium]
MNKEIVIKVSKPESEIENQSFKQFRADLKALLSKGKIKVVEKYRDFTFTITECTTDEEQKVANFVKENKTVEFMP